MRKIVKMESYTDLLQFEEESKLNLTYCILQLQVYTYTNTACQNAFEVRIKMNPGIVLMNEI